MVGHRLPQLGETAHRRILVRGGGQRLGRSGDDVVRPAEIGEALAEIDRFMLARERRHALEDRGRKLCVERVHSRPISAWAASGARTLAPEMKKMKVSRGFGGGGSSA